MMYRIGIDIGGTSIKAGLVTEEKKIFYKSVKVTKKRDETAFIQGLIELIEQILKEAKLNYRDIEYIGIGSPGLIDSERGVIVSAGNLGLKNFPLKERLESILPLPVYVNNDANCAALGEYYSLEDTDISSFVMVTLGTGIGGGIILNHKIYEGFDGSAGEFGSIVVYDGNERMLWEDCASAQALVSWVEKAAMKHQDSLLCALMEMNDGRLNGELVFLALEQKDEVAETVFQEYIKYLGDGIISVLYIFRPEVISIGGGISQASQLWRPLMEYIAANSNWKKRDKQVKICKATLGNDAGIIGAAYLREYV